MSMHLLKTPFEVHDFVAVSPQQSTVVGDLSDVRIVLHALCCAGELLDETQLTIKRPTAARHATGIVGENGVSPPHL